jgi:hypothetical protein
MSTYQDNVRSALNALESHEIRKRITNGELTQDAHVVALELLQERGTSVDDLPTSPPEQHEESQPQGFISTCMAGRAPLWKAFWLLGLALGIPLAILDVLTRGNPLIGLLIAVLAQAMYSVAVWRCAFRSSSVVWGVLARIWIVLIWLALIVSVFRIARGA